MPKRLPYLLTLLFGLLICGCFIAAKAPVAAMQYDYVALTQFDNYLQVATAPDNLQDIKVDTKHRGSDGNVGFLLAKVNELEAQGYELVQQSTYMPSPNSYVRHYMLLRRPKQ